MATSQNNLEFYTAIFGANEVASALEKLIGAMDEMAGVADRASGASDALSSSLSDVSKTAKAARDGLIAAGSGGKEATLGLDEATASADRAAGAMDRASASGKGAGLGFRKGGLEAATADGYFGKLYKTLHTFERMGTPAILRATNWVGLGGVGVGYESVKSFMNYNNRILQSITQAGVPLKEQGQIFQGVLKISRETGQHANDIADAFYRVASSLSGSHASMKTLLEDTKAISEFNILGNIPTGASSEQSARVIMAAVNAHLRGTGGGVNGIVGLLNATVGAGDIRAPDLISAYGRGGLAVAKVNNLSGADFGASIDTLTKLGANGSAAGTSATRAIQMLFNQTSQGAKGYNMIGLDYNTLQKAEQKGGFGLVLQTLLDHMKKFAPFLNYPKFKGAAGRQGAINQMEQWFSNRLPQSFIKAWENKDLTPKQQEAILAMMLNKMFGGSRSSGTVAALLEFLPQFKQTKQSIIDHSSPAYEQRMVRLAEESPSRKLQRVQANIMADLIEIGKKLTPIVLKIADALGGFLNTVKKNSFILHAIVDAIGAFILAGIGIRIGAVGKAAMQLAGGWNAGFEKLLGKFGIKGTKPENWSNSRRLYEAKVNKDYVIFSDAVSLFSRTTAEERAEVRKERNRSFVSAVNKFARAVDLFAENVASGGGGGGGGRRRRKGSNIKGDIVSAEEKSYPFSGRYPALGPGESIPLGPSSPLAISERQRYLALNAGPNVIPMGGGAYPMGPGHPYYPPMAMGAIPSDVAARRLYFAHQFGLLGSSPQQLALGPGARNFALGGAPEFLALNEAPRFMPLHASLRSETSGAILARRALEGDLTHYDPFSLAAQIDAQRAQQLSGITGNVTRPGMSLVPMTNTSMVPYVGGGSSKGILTDSNGAIKTVESDAQKISATEAKKSSAFLGKISGFFEGKGGKLFNGMLGMLGGPVGMIAAAALPMALPMVVNAISGLTNWLRGNSKNPVTNATPVLTTQQLLAAQKTIQNKINQDIKDIASGKNVVSSSANLTAMLNQLGYVKTQLKPNAVINAQSRALIGINQAIKDFGGKSPYYIDQYGQPQLQKGSNFIAGMNALKNAGGGVYANFMADLKSGPNGVALAMTYLQNQYSGQKAAFQTPAQLAVLAKHNPLAAALINIDQNKTQLSSYQQLANMKPTTQNAAGSYVAMISDIAELTAKRNADLANARKYGHTATGAAYAQDASNIFDTIKELRAATQHISEKFHLSKESVDLIANGVADANAIAFAKIGLTKKDFTQAVSTGISNAASGVAIIVNKVNSTGVR